MVYGNVKTISKVIWTHFYSPHGTCIVRLVSTLSIAGSLNTGKLTLDVKKLTHAGDMHWTCIPSSIIPLSNYNFPSLVWMSTSALNQQFWRQFLRIQLDISIATAILRKHFYIICSARIGQWRKGKLKPTGFLKSHFLAASTGMKYP